jgi:hypothetical protein
VLFLWGGIAMITISVMMVGNHINGKIVCW